MGQLARENAAFIELIKSTATWASQLGWPTWHQSAFSIITFTYRDGMKLSKELRQIRHKQAHHP
jgi:hypothetical protein